MSAGRRILIIIAAMFPANTVFGLPRMFPIPNERLYVNNAAQPDIVTFRKESLTEFVTVFSVVLTFSTDVPLPESIISVPKATLDPPKDPHIIATARVPLVLMTCNSALRIYSTTLTPTRRGPFETTRPLRNVNRVEHDHASRMFRRNSVQKHDAQPSLPRQGVIALIGIIIMLSTSILCFTGWRLWVWRKRVAREERAAKHRLYEPFDVLDIVLPTSPERAMTRDNFRDESSPGFTVGVTSPKVSTLGTLTPYMSISPAHTSIKTTPPPMYAEFPVSALSPRISSKVPNSLRSPTFAELPRLVVVQSSFITTLHDELKIREGDILRLLQEYEDEWCYVQRVSSVSTEKGFVPWICIVDMPPAGTRGVHVPYASDN